MRTETDAGCRRRIWHSESFPFLSRRVTATTAQPAARESCAAKPVVSLQPRRWKTVPGRENPVLCTQFSFETCATFSLSKRSLSISLSLPFSRCVSFFALQRVRTQPYKETGQNGFLFRSLSWSSEPCRESCFGGANVFPRERGEREGREKAAAAAAATEVTL